MMCVRRHPQAATHVQDGADGVGHGHRRQQHEVAGEQHVDDVRGQKLEDKVQPEQRRGGIQWEEVGVLGGDGLHLWIGDAAVSWVELCV